MAWLISKAELLKRAEELLEAARLMTADQYICPKCLMLGKKDSDCYCDYESEDYDTKE